MAFTIQEVATKCDHDNAKLETVVKDVRRVTALFEQRTCISGIGISEVGRPLKRTPLSLTLEAASGALEDAGLAACDIDGISTWNSLAVPGLEGSPIEEVREALRLTVAFQHGGDAGSGGPFAALFAACMAVAVGLAKHVLVYRTVTEATAASLARATPETSVGHPVASGSARWTLPYGCFSPANTFAMYAKRHMHEFGTTRQQLGALVVNSRRNATLNPLALFRTPLTLEEYLGSRMVSDPICLYDCDAPADGSTAFIVSSAHFAADARHPAVGIEAIGTSVSGRASQEYWGDYADMAASQAAGHMWRRTDLKPADVDLVELYDGFSIMALAWLEALGFCHRGEGGEFVSGGERIALEGELPVNTDGGQLSAGRLHAYGLLYEGCLQLRGDAGARQVGNARIAVCTAGGGSIAGSVLLSRR